MMTAFKKWVVTPLSFVFFLAPIFQVVVAAIVGELYGYELKYMILSSGYPCLVSVAVVVWVGVNMKVSQQISLLAYIVGSILLIGFSKVALELSGEVFEVRESVAFKYTPVERQFTVMHGEKELTFPADQKFEDGGFVLKVATETDMYSDYFACPTASFDVECLKSTDSDVFIF